MERMRTPRGLFFPGEIMIPSSTPADTEKEIRNRKALEKAKRLGWEEDPHTLWTDGSAFPSGVAAAAVVGFVEPATAEVGPECVTVTSGGSLGTRLKGNRKRVGARKTYDMRTRSFVKRDSMGGFRGEVWSLGAQSMAFDAEVQALVRAVEICALDATEGTRFRIFTDSQAAMRRLQDDRPGLGQNLAIRAIRIARAGIYGRGATVSIQWIPGHQRVMGNELADAYARDEAERAELLRKARVERSDEAREK